MSICNSDFLIVYKDTVMRTDMVIQSCSIKIVFEGLRKKFTLQITILHNERI